jgi:hypothetical protein
MTDTDVTTDETEVRLEQEAVHFFEALERADRDGHEVADMQYAGADLELELPPLGEGDRGMVYRLRSTPLGLGDLGPLCMKVAKQQPVCRERLLEELKTTEFFLSEGITVPRIHHMDPQGRLCVKEFIEGESVTSLYLRFNQLTVPTQRLILEELERFLTKLLELFRKRPDCKVSISPNNIYVLREGERFKDPPQFVLIDPGTTLKKNYDGFSFSTYWNDVLPDRIAKYRRTGYLQWLVPQDVTSSERDEAKEFEIFRGLEPAEVLILLKYAKTLEFDPEEVIVREGAVGESFFLILEGEVEVRRGHYSKPGSWHLRLGPGSVLGEMAFLLRVPRSMTVVAATPCKTIEFEREPFQELLDANLTAPYKLVHNIAMTLAERLHSLDSTYEKVLEARHGAAGEA